MKRYLLLSVFVSGIVASNMHCMEEDPYGNYNPENYKLEYTQEEMQALAKFIEENPYANRATAQAIFEQEHGQQNPHGFEKAFNKIQSEYGTWRPVEIPQNIVPVEKPASIVKNIIAPLPKTNLFIRNKVPALSLRIIVTTNVRPTGLLQTQKEEVLFDKNLLPNGKTNIDLDSIKEENYPIKIRLYDTNNTQKVYSNINLVKTSVLSEKMNPRASATVERKKAQTESFDIVNKNGQLVFEPIKN